MKLINVDDIEWAQGVFVTTDTEEPLPIVHKIATIEMLRDWQEEVKAIPLDKIKKAREKIASSLNGLDTQDYAEKVAKFYIERDLRILDELIEESEK